VERFVKETYPLDELLFDELMLLQRNFLINYNNIKQYPQNISFKYDIPGYLQDQCDISTPVTYEFDFPEDKDQSLQRFCEQIFFARRRNFGKAWLTKK
jgi:hypothetical protein